MRKLLLAPLSIFAVAMVFVSGQGYAASQATPSGWAPSPTAATKPQVLVLGMYTMDDSRLDKYNLNARGVLSPKRQTQIQQVIAVLKRFRPTQVDLEVQSTEEPHLAARYIKYRAGKLALDRSWIQQIGFRLAKELGLKSVYGVDVPRNFPFKQVEQYAKKNGQSQQLDMLTTEIGKQEEGVAAYLPTHSVLQTLIRINSDAFGEKGVGLYYRTAYFSKPGGWAGADFVTAWYNTNIRIYANILHLIDSPHARILVMFGAGHLGWLRHDFESDPTVCLLTLSDFVNQRVTKPSCAK